jgi:hypothetical protein
MNEKKKFEGLPLCHNLAKVLLNDFLKWGFVWKKIYKYNLYQKKTFLISKDGTIIHTHDT